MKKAKKTIKTNKENYEKEKKQRSYINDMMRRDRKACAERDKELAKLGIKTECKDPKRDSPCIGCSFAIEVKPEGPFDSPFVCAGIPRILQRVKYAGSDLVRAGKEFVSTGKQQHDVLLKAQSNLLMAAEQISQLLVDKKLMCTQPLSIGDKPGCYTAIESLENYLRK